MKRRQPKQRSKFCEGYTLSGQPCRRRIAPDQRYCSSHSRASEIGLPPYVSITPTESFWVYLPIGKPIWHVGNPAGLEFKCLSNGREYAVSKYIAEGTYGAVYVGARNDLPDKIPVAIKVSKELFKGKSSKPLIDYDFVKEFYMHSTIRERTAKTSSPQVVVKMIDSFFLKTSSGLHGCIVTEKMDGTLSDLFNHFEGINHIEVLRFWLYACNFMATSLNLLHEHEIYHLDMKSSNVLWRRTQGRGRGVYLRLIDLGLGCCRGKACCGIDIPCRATGTYIPAEWRSGGDKFTPTYEEIDDPKRLIAGEEYAFAVTCHKLLSRVHPRLYSRNASISKFVEILDSARDDSLRARNSVSINLIAEVSGKLLGEMDSILPDMDESLSAIFPGRQ